MRAEVPPVTHHRDTYGSSPVRSLGSPALARHGKPNGRLIVLHGAVDTWLGAGVSPPLPNISVNWCIMHHRGAMNCTLTYSDVSRCRTGTGRWRGQGTENVSCVYRQVWTKQSTRDCARLRGVRTSLSRGWSGTRSRNFSKTMSAFRIRSFLSDAPVAVRVELFAGRWCRTATLLTGDRGHASGSER